MRIPDRDNLFSAFAKGFFIMIRVGKRNVPILALLITVLLTVGAGGAFARFLVDDTADMSAPKEKKESPEPEKKTNTRTPDINSALPSDTPRNITVTMLTGEYNSVQITWEALPEVRDTFLVLRSNFIQDTSGSLHSSVPIKSVPADKLRVVLDRNLLPGRYYYAIVPKSKYDAKKVQLFPGENYTTNPVVIQSELTAGDSRTVAMIKAVTIEDRSVLLTWEPIASFNGEYVIFRSRSALDTAEKIAKSEPVARLSSVKSRYLDTDLPPGRFFYAISCKTLDGVLYSDLKKNFNYTEDAVFIGGTIGIRGISAKREGSAVVIKWRVAADTGNRTFYLLRTEIRPSGRASLAGAVIIDTVQSHSLRFVDRTVTPGKYYYILAPVNYKDDDFTMLPGVNVTDPAVVVGGERKRESRTERPERQSYNEESPRLTERIEPVLPVIPDITPAKPDSADELSALQDITEPTRREPERQKNYAPDDHDRIKSQIKNLLKKEFENQEPDEAIESDRIRSEKSMLPRDDSDDTNPSRTEALPDRDADRDMDRNIDRDDDRNSREQYIPGRDVEWVVNGSFARGEYSRAILALKKAMPKLSGGDLARAKLFIARSYIEIGRYRDALGYLAHEDVKRYYPRESGFWRDYTIDRLR